MRKNKNNKDNIKIEDLFLAPDTKENRFLIKRAHREIEKEFGRCEKYNRDCAKKRIR